jgi:hypothetical protein
MTTKQPLSKELEQHAERMKRLADKQWATNEALQDNIRSAKENLSPEVIKHLAQGLGDSTKAISNMGKWFLYTLGKRIQSFSWLQFMRWETRDEYFTYLDTNGYKKTRWLLEKIAFVVERTKDKSLNFKKVRSDVDHYMKGMETMR